MSEQIGLGEAIAALRAELDGARRDGAAQWLRFQPGPVELELEVSLTKDVHGTIGWKVLEAGAARESGRRQVVRLTLTPELWDPAARRYRTDFLVAGELSPADLSAPPPPDPGAPDLPRTDADPE